MTYPNFFDDIPTITLKDDLSDFLGTCEDGIVTFSYLDITKISGHSCPTVLGAYMMIQKALKHLYQIHMYPERNALGMPKRGEIKIEFREAQDEGVTGVMANVATAITGATSDFGFKGLNTKFNRCNLLCFNAEIASLIRVTRIDTNESVMLNYDTSSMKKSPEMMDLMQKSLQGIATAEELNNFKTLWQNGVKATFSNIDNFITIVK